MRILLASPRGFCAGVNMAVDTVNEAIRILGTPLYVYHEIVHNRHVVQQFERRGVVFVDDIADVPENATVIFSAHGVSPDVREAAQARGCRMIDATCPLVTKVHIEARRYARRGCRVLLIGHAGHDEVIGTVGEAPDAVTIVQSVDDVRKLPFASGDEIAYVTQTTLSRDDADGIIAAIRARYPNVHQPPRIDICYATTNRQRAIRELAHEADVVLVVGSSNSSNSQRLAEISQRAGTETHLVDDATEIDHRWFDEADTVLLTAGASAPEHLVQQIINDLKARHDVEVIERCFTSEDTRFALPLSLRAIQREATR